MDPPCRRLLYQQRFGSGVQLQSPTSKLIRQSLRFGFKASNNEAEYESLIAGLRLAQAVKVKRLSAYCDSQLVTSQFSGDYDAHNERMDTYLRVVQDLAKSFEFFEFIKVPRGENVCADALVAFGSQLRDQVQRTIPIHKIAKPSINTKSDDTLLVTPVFGLSMEIDSLEPVTPQPQDDCRDPLISYVSTGTLFPR